MLQQKSWRWSPRCRGDEPVEYEYLTLATLEKGKKEAQYVGYFDQEKIGQALISGVDSDCIRGVDYTSGRTSTRQLQPALLHMHRYRLSHGRVCCCNFVTCHQVSPRSTFALSRTLHSLDAIPSHATYSITYM